MAKPTDTPLELDSARQIDFVEQAREHIVAAAVILKTLGADFRRVGWMLEDTLPYLDQAAADPTGEEPFPEDLARPEDQERDAATG